MRETLQQVKKLVATAAESVKAGVPPSEVYAEVASLALVSIAEELSEMNSRLAELKQVIHARL